MTPRSKKAKPSFDVARTPLESGAAGWVYRSDSSPASTTPVMAVKSAEIIDVVVTPAKPAKAATPGRVTPPPERTTAKRIESGIDLLLTPFTLPLMILFVKMRWIIGPRSSGR